MRIAIVADIHSNLEAFETVLEDIETQNVDRTICLGDITGYNANPNECIEIVRKKGIDSIMGNHDAACSGLETPWFFRSAARTAAVWTSEVLTEENRHFLRDLIPEINLNGVCLGVHGSPTSRDEYIFDWLDAMRQLQFLKERNVSICFFGHSHLPSFFSERGAHGKIEHRKPFILQPDNHYFINFGSVGQPRDSDPRTAYGIVEVNDQITIEFCRLEYDIETTCRKIKEANLPEQLARRLLIGK